MTPVAVVTGLIVFWLLFSVKVLNEYERGVIFRLGKALPKPKGPGLVIVAWPIDRMTRVSLRTVVLEVPLQDVITRDNVTVKVNAVVYFRVVDPLNSVIQVENFLSPLPEARPASAASSARPTWTSCCRARSPGGQLQEVIASTPTRGREVTRSR
jgi:regulator of protease activity HflC (stomatin/prohibitin superfamily)